MTRLDADRPFHLSEAEPADRQGPAADTGWAGFPVLFVLALFMLSTGRWGSYVHVPGAPFYVGDALLVVAVVQAAVVRRRGGYKLVALRATPVAMRLAFLLALWALLRFLPRSGLGLVDLRDLAPYAYVVAAVVSFVLPVRPSTWVTRLAFATLTFHAAWFILSTIGWIHSAELLQVGPAGVTVFSTRPDFDAAVFGIAIGLALHQLLLRPRGSLTVSVALLCFIVLNTWGVLAQHTRAGLLATFVAAGAVIAIWLRSRSGRAVEAPTSKRWALPAAVVAGALVLGLLALLFTLPGQRFVDSFNGSHGEAEGTANARMYVYDHLSDYLLDDPLRAIVGVGFGPDFLRDSHTLDVLEGSTYKNVRSPHNYVLGTWARLGIVGSVLAALMLVTGIWLAWRRLPYGGTADVLAALVLLTLPVPAMVGVILESPFGALPYFWALGQVSAAYVSSRRT